MKDEGRRKKDEGWRMKDEGRRKKEEGRRMKDEGWRMKDEGWRMKEEGRRMKDEGWRMNDFIDFIDYWFHFSFWGPTNWHWGRWTFLIKKIVNSFVLGLWWVRIWNWDLYIEFQQKSNLMVLVRVRRTIKPEDFVFFTFLMESPFFWGTKHLLANRHLGWGPGPMGP